jgi:hypothetical protein
MEVSSSLCFAEEMCWPPGTLRCASEPPYCSAMRSPISPYISMSDTSICEVGSRPCWLLQMPSACSETVRNFIATANCAPFVLHEKINDREIQYD